MADTLTITDNRTGKQYEIPVTDSAIRATDLRQIRRADDAGLAIPGIHERPPARPCLHRRRLHLLSVEQLAER
jgi:hypothetical protein